MNNKIKSAHILLIIFGIMSLFLPIFISGHTLQFTPHPGITPDGPYKYNGPIVSRYISIDPTGSFLEDLLAIFAKNNFLNEKEISFWNPYQGIGQPYFATHISGQLYPLNIIRIILPYTWWDLFNILHLLMVGCFAYLYFCQTGFKRQIALIASFALMSCGFFSLYLIVSSVLRPLPWVFFLLFVIEKSFAQPDWKFKFASIIIGTYCLGTAGHPAATAIGSLFVGIYIAIKIISNKKLLRNGLLILTSMFLGFLIASPHWIPFLDYLYKIQEGIVNYDNYQYRLSGIAPAFFPYGFGCMNTYSLFGIAGEYPYWNMNWFPETISFFAVGGISYLFRKKLKCKHGILIIVCIAFLWKLFGLYPSSYMDILPFFKRLNYRYAGFIPAVLWSILSAYGFIFLCKEPRHFFRINVPMFAAFVGLIIISIFITFSSLHAFSQLLKYIYSGDILNGGILFVAALIWLIVIPASFYVLYRTGKGSLRRNIILFMSGTLFQTAGYFPNMMVNGTKFAVISSIVFYLVVFTAVYFSHNMSSGLSHSVPILCAFLLVCWIYQFYPGQPERYDMLTPAPYVENLRKNIKNEQRIYGMGRIMFPATGSSLGISCINMLEAVVPVNITNLFKRYLDKEQVPDRFFGSDELHSVESFYENKKVWDLIGIKYLLSKSNIDSILVSGKLRGDDHIPVPLNEPLILNVSGKNGHFSKAAFLVSTYGSKDPGTLRLGVYNGITPKRDDAVPTLFQGDEIIEDVEEDSDFNTVQFLISTYNQKNSGDLILSLISSEGVPEDDIQNVLKKSEPIVVSKKIDFGYVSGPRSFNNIRVLLSNFSKRSEGFIVVSLFDKMGNLLDKTIGTANNFRENYWHDFNLKSIVHINNDQKVRIELALQNKADNASVAVWRSKKSNIYCFKTERIVDQCNIRMESLKDNAWQEFKLNNLIKTKVRGKCFLRLSCYPDDKKSIIALWRRKDTGKIFYCREKLLAEEFLKLDEFDDNRWKEFDFHKKFCQNKNDKVELRLKCVNKDPKKLIAVWISPSNNSVLHGIYRAGSPLKKIYEDPETRIKIWKNENAEERAFFCPKVSWTKDQKDALAMIPVLAENKDTAFVEQKYKDSVQISISQKPCNKKGVLRSLKVSANRADLVYDVPCNGVVVMTDLYMPGWRAKIDGKECKTFPVNGVFRGVYVNKSGPVRIEFRYRPRLWNFALMISGVGLLCVVLLTWFQYRKRS